MPSKTEAADRPRWISPSIPCHWVSGLEWFSVFCESVSLPGRSEKKKKKKTIRHYYHQFQISSDYVVFIFLAKSQVYFADQVYSGFHRCRRCVWLRIWQKCFIGARAWKEGVYRSFLFVSCKLKIDNREVFFDENNYLMCHQE